jgi:large subunit ribosomal protein L9
MKVILNKDLAPLGEEGDVKDVAKGYARNFLFPRGIALPHNERTIKLFESRREEIEARKVQKRGDAAGLKEKLESLSLDITVPAGPNGKLYGAVTSQTVVDELGKQGYQIERKKIEVPGTHIKNVGKYKVTVKLYESAAAEVSINVIGQEIKTETPKAPAKPPRRRREENTREGTSHEGAPHEDASTTAARESPSGESPAVETPSASGSEAAGSPEGQSALSPEPAQS